LARTICANAGEPELIVCGFLQCWVTYYMDQPLLKPHQRGLRRVLASLTLGFSVCTPRMADIDDLRNALATHRHIRNREAADIDLSLPTRSDQRGRCHPMVEPRVCSLKESLPAASARKRLNTFEVVKPIPV
jgi:hypothetical protein